MAVNIFRRRSTYTILGLSPASDILVKNGDTVYLYSSSAPFNLRLNECIGYVAHVANFVPALPLNCPYINQSQIQNFTGQCQNILIRSADVSAEYVEPADSAQRLRVPGLSRK